MAYYLVHKNKIKENVKKLKQAFVAKKLNFQLFYSVKTNFSAPVLEIISKSDCGLEILSDLEWQKIKVFNPKTVVLNGPAKQLELVKNILNAVDILYFNIDNDTDFEIINKTDSIQRQKLKIGLRVYLNAYDIWNRFGYDIDSSDLIKKIKQLGFVDKLAGIHFHFSTNNFKIANYQKLLIKIREFADKNKIELEFLDIGGGLPAANEFIYDQDVYQILPDLITKLFPKTRIISEAGRNIVADAMDLETEIISLKRTEKDKFQVTVDINILHFPCVYEKKFWIEYKPLKSNGKRPVEIEIWGNSCMQIDKIADAILINQEPKVGDKIIIHNIGAYSYSQAANFISLIPEVKNYE
jgi:diaminopimelate decarboxylase